MELLSKLADIASASDVPRTLESILQEITVSAENRVSSEDLMRTLDASGLFSMVDVDMYAASSRLFNGVRLFALPEDFDVAKGEAVFGGIEAGRILLPSLHKGKATLVDGETTFSVETDIEPASAVVLRGIQQWYTKNGFVPGRDILMLEVADYAQCVYRMKLFSFDELHALLDSAEVHQFYELAEEILVNRLLAANGSNDASVGLLVLLGYCLAFRNFHSLNIPANITFYFSLDSRFAISDERVILQNDLPPDFTDHYLGESASLSIDGEEDLDMLDMAIGYLFEEDKAREAQVILKKLKLKYPDEPILNRFLYQSAYFLAEDSAVFKYTRESIEHFPGDPDPWRILSELYLHNEDMEMAEQCCREALQRVHPEDTETLMDVLTMQMFIYTDIGNSEEAVLTAKRILEIDAENPDALYLLDSESYPGIREVPSENANNIIQVDFSQNTREED